MLEFLSRARGIGYSSPPREVHTRTVRDTCLPRHRTYGLGGKAKGGGRKSELTISLLLETARGRCSHCDLGGWCPKVSRESEDHALSDVHPFARQRARKSGQSGGQGLHV